MLFHNFGSVGSKCYLYLYREYSNHELSVDNFFGYNRNYLNEKSSGREACVTI